VTVPWWSWVIIWTVLVLLLFGMLAWFAVVLFKKLMATLHAVGELGDQLAALDTRLDDLGRERFRPAIWADRAALARDIERRRALRMRRRQEKQDARVARGKLIRQAPLNQRTFPHA
jgi:hypothetical protein